MSRQGSRVSGGRARGGVRPQPPEDLQVCDKAGAQAGPQARVHYRAQGDLHPQVYPAQAGAQAPADPLVSGPHPRRPGREL